MSENTVKWHPYPNDKPPSVLKEYLVTLRYKPNKEFAILNKDTWDCYERGGSWERFNNDPYFEIVAWAEKPELYKTEKDYDTRPIK